VIRRRRNESGASVVLALVFLSLFGLFISAILTFTESSLLVSRQASIGADQVYGADGALEGAINVVATNASAGVDGSGTPCSFLHAGVTVTCAPKTGSGVASTTRPAIAAYGESEQEGVRLSGAGDLAVGGDVVSNSKLVVADPARKMTVHGNALAAKGCEPDPVSQPSPVSIQTLGPGTRVDCAAPVSPQGYPPLLIDPAADPTALVQRRPPTTEVACAAGSPRTVLPPLEPGLYVDAVALSALTSSGSCGNKVVRFNPGLYYFDFGFGQGSICTSVPSTCEWKINMPTGGAVGGTSTVDFEAAPSPLPATGNCVIDAPGVQFVFGDGSHLSVVDGTVELCGQQAVDQRRAVVQGLADVPLGQRLATDGPTDTLGITNQAKFNLPLQGRTIDGTLTEARLDGELATASLDVSFASMTPRIPDDAVIDAAMLRVRHREQGDVSVTATVTSLAAPKTFDPVPVPVQTVLSEDRIVLPLELKTPGALNGGVAVTYRVERRDGPAGIEQLDGIELAIAYTVPSPASLQSPATAASARAQPAGSFLPDDNDAARLVGEPAAQATLTSSNQTASVRFEFPARSAPQTIPIGATINSAVLRVVHAEVGEPGTSLGLAVTVNPGGVGSPPVQSLVADNPTLAADGVNLRALGFDTPEELNAAMSVDFTAKWMSGGQVTESLDGIDVQVEYTPPVPANRVAASTTATGFAPAEGARVIADNSVARATLAGVRSTASVDAQFPRPPAENLIPAEAIINRAVLRVAHAETVGNNPNLQVAITPEGSPSPLQPQTIPVISGDQIGTYEVDLRSAGLALDTPDELNAAMSIRFTAATLNEGDRVDVFLDGMAVDVAYTLPPKPTFRPPTGGCLPSVPYNPAEVGTTCALLKVSSSSQVTLHGEVHAPGAAIDVALDGNSLLVEHGIAGRTIRVGVASAAPPDSCPIQVPRKPRANRIVDFRAQGAVPMNATVEFVDQFSALEDGGDPTPCATVLPVAKATVRDWAVRRAT
jgi:hypothetical protein